MFNLKKFSSFDKLSQVTPEELVSRNIPETTEFPFLDKFQSDIDSLRKLAGDLIKMEGSETPTPDIIQRVIQKLLDRTGKVFIPELVKFRTTSQRKPELASGLLEYQKPEEIAAIRNFIATEILAKRLEVQKEFNEILAVGKRFNPDFTLEMLCFILQNNPKAISENEEILAVLNGEQAGELKGLINQLVQKVRMMNSNVRIWNRILEVHSDIVDRDKWAALIPDDLRIQWDLISILKYFNYPLSNVPEKVRTETRRTADRDEKYYYFYPEKDDMGRELVTDEDKRRFALSKLKECVENGYDNERIFELLGLKIKKGPIKKGRPKKETLTEEPEVEEIEEVEVEETEVPTRQANDSFGSKIRYYYNYLVKPGSSISVFDPSTRLAVFRQDLREAGLPAVAEMLGRAYEKPEDQRYAEFDLKFLSQEEKNICELLRDKFSLDPIPFPVKIPCPVDNPTSTERFEIDFLLPADVLIGFEEVEEGETIDYTTGEVRTRRIIKPIIESQIIFVGEYFGIRYTMPKKIEDKGRPWVKPDGSIPVYEYRTGAKYTVIPGGQCRELEFYKLKTEWKIFTTEIIGDMLGTRTLSLDDSDLDYPKNLMFKLDQQRIIYKSEYCDDRRGCMAYKEIMKRATKTPEIDVYIDDTAIRNRFDDMKYRSINIIDCAIVNVKLSEAMMRAKKEFVANPSSPGLDRKAMWYHKQLFDDLKEREKILSRQLAVKADLETFNKLNELRREIKQLNSSPLYAFKMFLDKTLTEGTLSRKISDLNELKRLIQEDKIKPSLSELRSMIINISPDMIGQLEERGKGAE